MAAVRRSTRLSAAASSLPPTPQSQSLQTAKQSEVRGRRRSDVWKIRQPTVIIVDSDEDSDDRISLVSENNENRSHLLNKMDNGSSRRRTTTGSRVHIPDNEPPKTPRSSKKTSKTAASRAKRIEENEEAVRIFLESSDDEDVVNASPPKQRKIQPLPQHLISPSRLLDRLSIDERQEEDPKETKTEKQQEKHSKKKTQPQAKKDQLPEEEETKTEEPCLSPEFKPRNKYQNARRVLNSAETQNLPGREEQLQQLREFFTSHLETQTSGSLYVSGQPGTGKTACLSLLLRDPEFSKRLQRVYINCTSIASVGAVYKLCSELQLKVSGRTERDHMEAIQRHLRTAKKMLLLVLDEIDQLCTSRQEVLYTIFEWPALPGARLLLVGIANSLDLTDRALMRLNARCELKPRLMHFPPYSKQQIVEIFKSRLAEAEVLDVFPPVTLQLLAAKVSAISGDVRRALDIGRRVVEIAEQQKRDGEKEFNMKALELEGKDKEVAQKQGKNIKDT